jgi:anti-sigma regulatory factor (Ser/Thr protein kinase)
MPGPVSVAIAARASTEAFCHDAFLYSTDRQFLEGTLGFIGDALVGKAPILVMVSQAKIDALRSQLGRDAERVRFADMAQTGANPARIIPAWRAFVSQHPSNARLRGIGEPIWPGRTADELIECHRHEALINLAFAGAAGFRLLCPYDTASLGQPVLDGASQTHPRLVAGHRQWTSAGFRDVELVAAPFDDALPELPSGHEGTPFTVGRLARLRRLVAGEAAGAGLATDQTNDLVMAVNELATNSIVHGGGRGTLEIGRSDAGLVCDIRDAGHITDPLVGRKMPDPEQTGGRGVWLANQVCDLVQVRSGPAGTVIRLHMRRR